MVTPSFTWLYKNAPIKRCVKCRNPMNKYTHNVVWKNNNLAPNVCYGCTTKMYYWM